MSWTFWSGGWWPSARSHGCQFCCCRSWMAARLTESIKIPSSSMTWRHTPGSLVALPRMLIIAELVVHRRVSPVMRRLVERRIVETKDLPRFAAAVASALRARNSIALELSLVALVYSAGLWLWRSQMAVGVPTWYAVPDAGHLNLTLPGYWYAYVSIPIFQFILLRWYVRLFLWFRLLWKVSRLNLHLTGAHPDRSGGIGFIGHSSYAFTPILFAQGTLLSGLIASRVLYQGQDLLSFKMEAAGMIVAMVLVILGPLVMFSAQMDLARRKSLAEYGLLANRYVFGFEEEVDPRRPPGYE